MSWFGAAWKFLTSPDALYVLATVGGTIWGWVTRKDKRAARVNGLIDEYWEVAESIIKLTPGRKFTEDDRWKLFEAKWCDAMKANGLGRPTKAEVNRARVRTESKMHRDVLWNGISGDAS